MRRCSRWLNPMLMHGTLSDSDLARTRINENLALAAMAAWSGTDLDLVTLMHATHLARALAAMGYGVDEVPAISRATAALARCRTLRPHSRGLEGDDLDAVRDLLLLLERQRSVASAADYARALLRVQG